MSIAYCKRARVGSNAKCHDFKRKENVALKSIRLRRHSDARNDMSSLPTHPTSVCEQQAPSWISQGTEPQGTDRDAI